MSAQPGAPDCGLYIRVPQSFVIEEIIPKLQQIFSTAKHSAYEKHMHVIEFPIPNGTKEDEINIRALIDFARQNGFVPLIAGDANWASDLDADGVLVANPADIPPARALLGDEGIIGLTCRAGRPAAEQALALGTDYLALPGPDLEGDIAWWIGKTDIPVLADTPVTNDTCAAYVQAGATFVDPTAHLLGHPKGVVQGTIDMLYAIDLALRKQTPH